MCPVIRLNLSKVPSTKATKFTRFQGQRLTFVCFVPFVDELFSHSIP